jgi:adenine-specific DNA-methyltransferase
MSKEISVKKIQPGEPETMSQDMIKQNLEQLRGLFPEAWTDGQIDFEVLRQLLGGAVDDREEKYGLNWHGKRDARRLALTPSVGTLLPQPDDSVDWNSTKNIFIEGDNLEVLKLLQKSYAGKVKLIYIDPPYNTGNDFIYPDDFHDSIRNYQELTGQIDNEGRRTSSNTEAGGRFHTQWLNMMYPRLKLARTLLRQDGFIMISIDDHELSNLRRLCDEVFGEESFLIQFVWRRRSMADSRNEDRASSDHEYVVCYKMPDARLKGEPIDTDKYSNPDNDPRGPWFSADLTGIANASERPNLHYDLVNPATGLSYPPSPTRGWSCARDTMARMIEEKRILWPNRPDGRPRHKKFLQEITRHETGLSSWLDMVGQTSEGTQLIQSLFGEKIFPFSKPVSLLKKLVEQAVPDEGGLVLDFFAGSGTTAHAVLEQNSVDNISRRFILVQLPEATGREDFECITAITKERVRRVGKRLREELLCDGVDLGFRVLKLASSNINLWSPDPNGLDMSLLNSVEHIKADRSNEDVLYELLIKLGLDLCVPIEDKLITGKRVYSIGAGSLIVCLEADIAQNEAESLALGIVNWRSQQNPSGESTVVFRDSGFADDVTKTNVTAILQQHGLDNVRSL